MQHLLSQLAILGFTILMIGCGGGNSTSENGNSLTQPPTSSVNTSAYEQYVVAQATQLNSLTDNENISDLAQMTAHFNDKRIVQLGESTHGSRQMNQIKTRIIKYLHQYHNFNVVAFESSMYSCNLNLETSIETAQNLLASCVFGVWHSYEVLELFEYIIETQSTERPLKLAGFDVQFSSGAYPASSLSTYINQVIHEYQLTPSFDLNMHLQRLLEVANAAYQCRDNSNSSHCDLLENEYLNAIASIELITNYFAGLGNEFSMPAAIVKSQQLRLIMLKADIDGGITAGMKARDAGMAENFITLAETIYPNEKIIIWAHNFHIAESYPAQQYQDKYMGALLDEHFADQLYTVGLYMLTGESANNDRSVIKVASHQADSLESIVQATNLAPLFLPLSKENQSTANDDWLHTQTRAKQWGRGNAELILSDNYDALIVIDESSIPHYIY